MRKMTVRSVNERYTVVRKRNVREGLLERRNSVHSESGRGMKGNDTVIEGTCIPALSGAIKF